MILLGSVEKKLYLYIKIKRGSQGALLGVTLILHIRPGLPLMVPHHIIL
jgi:hypothetical protein